MANAIYKDYLIVSSAELDAVSDTWTCNVLISWKLEHGQFNFHQLYSSEHFVDAGEAPSFGIDLAKAWIDARM